MLHKFAITAMLGCAAMTAFTQTPASSIDTTTQTLSELVIISTRAEDRTPMTFNNLSKEQIEKLNLGQDIPYLLRSVPSLVFTSDGGTGIGYTGLWLRGSDPSRINVTINDIPLNDPESQQVFWVNLPDFASTTDDIQVQRGVGTSTNGTASFGGSIRLGTNKINFNPYVRLSNTVGSFNTLKNTVAFGTGKISEHFVVEGRLSRIASDGYIDRASARLGSYFLSGSYIKNKTSLKATLFSGQERTYQSWYGTPHSRLINNRDSMLTYAANNGLTEAETQNLLTSGRTYNYYTYANQVDDYKQSQYQLHLAHNFNARWVLNLAAHYTKGAGFFEEFKASEDFERYGLTPPNDSITSTDVVRRRWLRNDFYGTTFSITHRKGRNEFTLGGAANQYVGEHFGELTWMQYAFDAIKDNRYYEGNSTKNDGNIYFRSAINFTEKLHTYIDIQGRLVDYRTKGIDNDLRAYDVDDQLFFFNPKIGVSYLINNRHSTYASAAIGNKEPNRNDYVDALEGTTPKPESMLDIEAGYKFTGNKFGVKANIYYMNYKNQLVITGELNDVGAYLRTNVDKSFRRGIEIEANAQIHKRLYAEANVTLSQNKIQNFTETLYDYTVDFAIVNNNYTNTDISFSPSVIAGGRVEYNFWKSFYFNWMPRYVGKQYLDNTQSEYLSLDAYFVNDVSVQWKHTFKNNSSVTVQCMVNNALDAMYSSNGYTYSYIVGSRITEKLLYPQAGRFYLTSLQLTI
jgi:iron complex outermembrane recepter protein